MVVAVASLASLMMSAALFGRRSKKGVDDPPNGSTSGARGAPSGPNVFAPGSDHGGPPPAPVAERAPAAEVADPVDVGPALVDPAAGKGGDAQGAEHNDGVIGGPLLAELEVRAQSNDPAPHPVRPQEMWHPGVTPLPVDLPPPPTEERIDQAELEGSDSAPGRFRFNRLRRVSPGEAPVGPVDVPVAEDASEESIGDVLFGELFTSDRIPSGTEGLGSGAAPLVPGSGGAAGALINGPVGRNARNEGRALHRSADGPRDRLVEESAEGHEDDAPKSVLAGTAPSDDPRQDSVDDQIPEAVDDHDADPVVEPSVAVGPPSEPEAHQPKPVVLDAGGSADLEDASLRFAETADVTVVGHDATLSVHLVDGWCWAALGNDARPIEVITEGLALQCPAATTVLVTVDDSGRFVVVVRGEAVLRVGGRRIRLRTGAMAFLPHGAEEAQVDVASEAEVAADPLVARNLSLDAKS